MESATSPAPSEAKPALPWPFVFGVCGSKGRVLDNLVRCGDTLYATFAHSLRLDEVMKGLTIALHKVRAFDCSSDPALGVKVDIGITDESLVVQVKPYTIKLNPAAGICCIEDAEDHAEKMLAKQQAEEAELKAKHG